MSLKNFFFSGKVSHTLLVAITILGSGLLVSLGISFSEHWEIKNILEPQNLKEDPFKYIPTSNDKKISRPEVLLNLESKGVLSLNEDFAFSTALLFTEENSLVRKEIFLFENASRHSFATYKNKIYFLREQQLHLFNPFTQKLTPITTPTSIGAAGAAVHDFWIRNDTAFFLAGEWCDDYLLDCNLNLYKQALTSTSSTLLASGLRSRDILGYRDEKLFMRYKDVDGGCSWSRYEIFDFKRQKASLLAKFSYCSYEGDWKEQFEAEEILVDGIRGQTKTYSRLQIDAGTVVGDELSTSTTRWNSFIVFSDS